MNMGEFKKASALLEQGGSTNKVLAMARTSMAADRTLMAYTKATLAVLVTGLGFIKLMDNRALEVCGWCLVGLSFVLPCFGGARYIKAKKLLKAIIEMEHAKQDKKQSHSGDI